MDTFQPLLLKIWQEACRHIRLDEMLIIAAPMLRQDFPLGRISICRLEQEKMSVSITATAASVDAEDEPTPAGRIYCTAKQYKALQGWWRTQTSGRIGACGSLPCPLQALIQLTGGHDAIFVPLGLPDGIQSILILSSTKEHNFLERHEKLAELLREPFTAALENDRQLHELDSLREAAEADKRSLMERLYRREPADSIVGADSGLRLVFERIGMVAPLDVPVLILGETGSGKEIIARAIHVRSKRERAAFIRVNCGAIPTGLIDSQLFGHEKGAFTGAAETRKGWFERADGGTLFLDEIGELPLEAQVRLLRILQDGWLERVGGQKPIQVNVRIIAATHRDLASEVVKRTFRDDLWYRLAVFPIRLPALRERPEDIPALAKHFAKLASKQFGLRTVMPTPEDIGVLKSYQWPGNVRELASVIDRAAILGGGRRLEVHAALGILDGRCTEPEREKVVRSGAPCKVQREFKTLAEIQQEHITAVLEELHGRIDGPHGAARRLGIHPSTLRAKMRKLGISWRSYRRQATEALH